MGAGQAARSLITPEIEPLLTIAELADLASQSRRTIERKVREGEIETVHLGPRAVRIRASEAKRYLQHPDDRRKREDEA